MCGIFGIVCASKRDDLGEVMVRAARRLSYRGYDSVGMATFTGNGQIDLRKDVGDITKTNAQLHFDAMTGDRGLLQLRWSTFGRPSTTNAQPHLTMNRDMVGAHNGNITNNPFVREDLQAEGATFESENDGETLVLLVEKYLSRGMSPEEAYTQVSHDTEGDFAQVFMRRDKHEMYAAKMGSSLYLGLADDFICVSSDLPSILEFTRKYVRLENGDLVIFDDKNYRIFRLPEQQYVERPVTVSDIDIENANKEPFAHYFIKEIHEQVEGTHNLLSLYDGTSVWQDFIEALDSADRVFMTGAGTSYHALLLGAYYFNKLARLPVFPSWGSQMLPLYAASVREGDLIVLVSQSGETKDLMNVYEWAKAKGVARTFSVVNNIGSTLALHCDGMIPICSYLEISVPATKTYTNQVLCFLYAAMKLAEHRGIPYEGITWDDLHRVPRLIQETIEMSQQPVKELASVLLEHPSMHILGHDMTHPVAMEGALKMKEVVYNHPEGMYSSEFKHGPLASVDEGYPVIFVSLPENEDLVLSHMNEVICRQGIVVHVGQPSKGYDKIAHYKLPIPAMGNPYLRRR
ncbi:MAG: hypothetical protein B1H03_05070 [Planctomycetales bacterium 4484_113]|nr:MAG: hypothetical protein B1H03_05070 [Planctomycetales bacterium 4484_113]